MKMMIMTNFKANRKCLGQLT